MAKGTLSHQYKLPQERSAEDWHARINWSFSRRYLIKKIEGLGFKNFFNSKSDNQNSEADEYYSAFDFKGFVEEALSLNPELASVNFDINNSDHLYDVTYGVLQNIKPRDINHYIAEYYPEEKDNKRSSAYNVLLGSKAGAYPGWVMSAETINDIKKLLSLQDFDPTNEELDRVLRYDPEMDSYVINQEFVI